MTLYDGIVSLGLAFHEQQPPLIKRPGARGRQARRPGHNLLIRLHNFKDDVLRFASNFAVPFTNNQAEQDIRMMKVKMKISGCFPGRGRGLCRPPVRHLNSQETAMGYPKNPVIPAEYPYRCIACLKTGLGVT